MPAVTIRKNPVVKYHTAKLNGVTYNYLVAEPASCVVVGTIFLLHGWPDLSLEWRNQIPLLLFKGLGVVAPDMMGYGGTDAPEEVEFYTYKRAADDVAALAKHLGLSRIVLGGHDWGGAVAYRAALWHPELISAFFVLEYIGLPQNATRVRQILNTAYGVTLPNGVSAFNITGDGLEFELLDQVTEDSPFLTPEEMAFYVENYSADPFNRTLNWYRISEPNWKDELPALFVGGLQDPALPPALSEGMETYFDSLIRHSVTGGHFVMWESIEAVNSHIGNWLGTSVLGSLSVGLNLTAGSGLLN
ncbi:hypothetical protein CGLO_07246 [Colletotrichum gloeosporioides Cg-14]|uniref:AB hydrolase-1 domain-containing protein n=1 Tax=Colletotrichum gloeosporioides (strain Cg-14) TaxID=1237896 RepID=T0LXE5_COLGC|nr:hypothetical protein CGLO_07246 [Colletotrichum gloeosporioides Cg-14]